MRILLVEDDLMLVNVLTKSLAAQNYSVDSVRDGSTAWEYLTHIDYDLILLDVLLPHLDGVSLCRRIRAEQNETPILIMTAQHNSRARVRGLDAGADDYVVKPFDIEELMARIRALIRRSGRDLSPILQLGQLVFDPGHCTTSYGGMPLSLSAKEYALLDLFFHEPNHVFSIPELLDSLWSSEEYPAEATVRSHIRRLRAKLIDAGAPQDYISNVHGRGYFLNPNGGLNAPGKQNILIDEQQLQPLKKEPNQSLDAQYQRFLAETWHQFQPKVLKDVEQLEQLLEPLQYPQDSVPDLDAAHLLAHRLKGTLGLFQQPSAMSSAAFLEAFLEAFMEESQKGSRESCVHPSDSQTSLSSAFLDLKGHLQRIKETLQSDLPLTAPSTPHDTELQPVFFCISDDESFQQAMITAAKTLPLTLVTMSNRFLISDRLWNQLPPQRPDGIIVSLYHPASSDSGLEPKLLEPKLEQLNHLRTVYAPNDPPTLFLLGESIDFATRLESVRYGARYLLNKNQQPSRLLQTCLALLPPPKTFPKALMVDDDEPWLQFMALQLQNSGFQIKTLSDPHDFEPMLVVTQPDILILDVKIPQVSGLELCQTIRSDMHWQSLPVIFVSALTDQKTQASAFSAGADDYLCKPIQSKDLAHRMMTRLQRNQTLMHWRLDNGCAMFQE